MELKKDINEADVANTLKRKVTKEVIENIIIEITKYIFSNIKNIIFQSLTYNNKTNKNQLLHLTNQNIIKKLLIKTSKEKNFQQNKQMPVIREFWRNGDL